MSLINYGIRMFILTPGMAVRWLEADLNAANVEISLSEGCLDELVREADIVAQQAALASDGEMPYLTSLREQLTQQAALVARWTQSDDKIAAEGKSGEAFVKIARRYGLPRPWKLVEPIAVISRPQRSYWNWTSETGAQYVSQD